MTPELIKTLSEADTRAKLIDPAIHKRGWSEDLIRREETVGAIDIIGEKPRRRSKGRVDYTLRIRVNPNTQPVAVAFIEAKKASLPPGHGLPQVKSYMICKRLHVPFVFSSNGFMFVEFDRFTGLTSKSKPMIEFPTPSELRERYEKNMGFSLESPAAKPLLQPYKGGEGTRRYYQDAAIRAVFEKIAVCEINSQPKRALLSLATGAGKTFIAVNLLKRIADAGQLRRTLFVCDRDELRNQGLKAFQNIFGSDAAEVFKTSDNRNHAKNARIHVATYQTLGIDTDDGDASFLTTFYPEDYFSHIVIDECHRSAWGKWSLLLTRNSKAVHIGLTATPREFKTENTEESKADTQITANNIQYFGEPVYEYDMAQAIEDGYLAACEIQNGLDKPNIWHGNTLTGKGFYGGLFEGNPLQFNVILTNPPFGGKEGKDAQTDFDYKTSSTQVLFLQHVLKSLKDGGRCGIVVDEGLLFRTNQDAFVKTKRKLSDDCDIWCIVSLPGGVFTAAGAGVKTNLVFFTKGKPTKKIWYYDLSDIKVGKKTPLTLRHFEDFFALLPKQADSELSWIVDLEERKQKALDEAKPFKEKANRKQQEANQWKEKLRELKKIKPPDKKVIAEAETRDKELTKAAKELLNKAKEIEDAVYDLKAVNPNKKPVIDTRTPEELLEIIEAKGKEISEALAVLRIKERKAAGKKC